MNLERLLESVGKQIFIKYYDYFQNIEKYSKLYGIDKERFIISSDAHYLTDMRDKENSFSIDDGLRDDEVRRLIFEILRRASK